MSDVDDLVAWLRRQLDEDEAYARAASEPYPYRDDQSIGAPEIGCRWQWVAGENWTPAAPEPMVNEFVAPPGEGCNLATVETWETSWELESGERVGHRKMPNVAANSMVEVRSTWAAHIARNDPAAVLADVAAKRLILAEHQPRSERASWDEDVTICATCRYDGGLDWVAYPCPTVRLLASAYASRPGYRSEWRP